MLKKLKSWAKSIKSQILVVWFIAKDERTPIFVKILAVFFAAYALSPIDLIPDFIPVLGYLDDIIIVPVGIILVIKLTPQNIIDDCRALAATFAEKPISHYAAAVIILIWIIVSVLLIKYFFLEDLIHFIQFLT